MKIPRQFSMISRVHEAGRDLDVLPSWPLRRTGAKCKIVTIFVSKSLLIPLWQSGRLGLLLFIQRKQEAVRRALETIRLGEHLSTVGVGSSAIRKKSGWMR